MQLVARLGNGEMPARGIYTAGDYERRQEGIRRKPGRALPDCSALLIGIGGGAGVEQLRGRGEFTVQVDWK